MRKLKKYKPTPFILPEPVDFPVRFIVGPGWGESAAKFLVNLDPLLQIVNLLDDFLFLPRHVRHPLQGYALRYAGLRGQRMPLVN